MPVNTTRTTRLQTARRSKTASAHHALTLRTRKKRATITCTNADNSRLEDGDCADGFSKKDNNTSDTCEPNNVVAECSIGEVCTHIRGQMVDNVGVTLDNAQHPVRIGDDTLLFGAMSSDRWWKMVSTDMEGKMKETRHIAVPKGPNTAAPDGFQEKDGSGRCKCRGNGKGLNSCGGLCCAASPFTAFEPHL